MNLHAIPLRLPARRLRVSRLSARDRDAALAFLERDARANLLLIDLVRRLGAPPAPGEEPLELLAAWRGSQLAGVGAIRPSIVFDSELGAEVLEAFLPHVARLPAGLLKGSPERVRLLWARLEARGSRAILDRSEVSCAVTPARLAPAPLPVGARLRNATHCDLDALVEAARASLCEEGRADPHDGDPQGFRRWVQGRIPRARIVEAKGRIAFVGYADVRCREGWLLQGVYTWREQRRQGLACAGVSDLCAAAFREGARHVQLSVVDGNAPARRLYEGLGFRPYARLRTILFA